MKTRKSWRDKLADSKDLPKTLLIPAPREVDEMMARVPPGKVATINEIRAALARKHNTTMTCPLTTGIFAWIAAHAAEEAAAAGRTDITPYWRTLKVDGQLNAKYPGGVAAQKKRLVAEGHAIVKKGQKSFVADYGKVLCDFTTLSGRRTRAGA
ncbi:MAG: MGMT family protein [Planctomycetota bacterium]|nr:MGMT family protein [Planctomycetota bacterium]